MPGKRSIASVVHHQNLHKAFNTRERSSISTQRRFYADKTFPVPNLGMDTVTEGTLGTWQKKVNDYVNVDDVVAVLETDKKEFDLRSPESGVLVRHLAKVGDTVRVGQDLFVVAIGEKAPTPPPSSPSTKAPEIATPPTSVSKPQQPQQPQQPQPTTPKPPTPKPPTPTAQSTTTTIKGTRSEHRERLPKIRKVIAQRLKDAQNTAAMLTTFNEIDMTNIIELRNKYKDAFQKKHGVKLGFMSAFIKASSVALSEFPEVNAVFEEDSILYRDYHDVAIAVATPKGLVVPVIRNAESLSFAQIEKTISTLAEKARDGSIAIEEMTGGTFTISNGGVYGSMMGTPILNPPQSAILGMHAVNQRATVVNGQIVIRPIMYVALTYDHRLIDGREAVSFLKKIKTCVEEPESMLLDI